MLVIPFMQPQTAAPENSRTCKSCISSELEKCKDKPKCDKYVEVSGKVRYRAEDQR